MKIRCDNCDTIHERRPYDVAAAEHHLCSYQCRCDYIRRQKQVRQPSDPAIRYIPLTKGKVAVVDTDDYEQVSRFNWYARKGKNNCWYAVTDVWHPTIKKKEHISMHRILVVTTKDQPFVDHINNNGLDNRRCNLRRCSNSENMGNCRKHRDSSSPKGTWWDKKRNQWGVQICHQYKKYFLGYYDDVEQAVLAYNKKAKELFGEYTTPITPQEVMRP